MFDIGFTELVLVGIIGLLILGPQRLPLAARTLGKWVGKAKNILGGVQQQIEEELRLEELARQTKHTLTPSDEEIVDKPVASQTSSNHASHQTQLESLKAEAQAMEVPVKSSSVIKQPINKSPYE